VDKWVDVFLEVSLMMAILGYLLPHAFWFSRILFPIRILTCLFLSTSLLVGIGAILAMLVLASQIGFLPILRFFSLDYVSSTTSGLLQTGFETAVLWFPAMLIKIIMLAIKDFRSSLVESQKTVMEIKDIPNQTGELNDSKKEVVIIPRKVTEKEPTISYIKPLKRAWIVISLIWLIFISVYEREVILNKLSNEQNITKNTLIKDSFSCAVEVDHKHSETNMFSQIEKQLAACGLEGEELHLGTSYYVREIKSDKKQKRKKIERFDDVLVVIFLPIILTGILLFGGFWAVSGLPKRRS
jgi:hypothetical protein